MSVFRRRWRGKDGSLKRSACFYGEYLDDQGIRRRVKLCEDKQASEMMLAEHKKRVALAGVGVTNRYQEHERRPLLEHLLDYGTYLAGKGNTTRYVREAVAKCRAVIEASRFERIPDLSASHFQECLARMRRGGLSAATSNHYLRAVKSFVAWLVQDCRTAENPLAYLKPVRMDADVRVQRRPLSEEEARRLVAAADASPLVMGMSGPLRALTYRLALTTGLRANEIRSLTYESFDLDGSGPTVTVEAAYSKHRRRDVLPLVGDVAEALREWRRQHPFDERVFPLPDKTAKMLRADLEAAGISYRDGAGRVVDFHALRHTFITNLMRGGVHVRVAQALARHSTVTLTMNTYSHPEVLDERSALSVLPSLSGTPTTEAVEPGAGG